MSVVVMFHKFVGQPENMDYSTMAVLRGKTCRHLKSLTESLKAPANRESLPSYVFLDMLHIMSRLSVVTHQELKKQKKMTEKAGLMVSTCAECFRALRNSCAGCKKNQEEVLRKTPGLFRVTGFILESLIKMDGSGGQSSTEVVQCLRCGVQFLGNAVAGFSESKTIVWESIFSILRPLLKAEDMTLANYTCMLLYTCMKDKHLEDLVTTQSGIDIVAAVILHFKKYDTEWGLYIIEKLLSHDPFLEMAYNRLEIMERELLMEFIAAKLKTLEEKSSSKAITKDSHPETNVAMSNILYLAQVFVGNAEKVFGGALKDSSGVELKAQCKIVLLLGSALGAHSQYIELQSHPNLLSTAVKSLSLIHHMGEAGENMFTNKGKLTDIGTNEELCVAGLKRDLIRLIANLSYQCVSNQDQVRELGGVELIMSHTKIDSRNPFIQQWAVFALRNLCNKNQKNQSVVGSQELQKMEQLDLSDLGPQASLTKSTLRISR